MFKQLFIILSIPAILLSGMHLNKGSCFQTRGADDYEYLITTTDALKNSFNDFIAFNERRCLRTQIQTIEYIKSNVAGNDEAEKLRNYIKEQYEKHNIVYVLLGGDGDYNSADRIPHKGLTAKVYGPGGTIYEHKNIAADMYYSCLDSAGLEFNDFSWEVYAARFPVDDEDELNNMISKTIKYSEEPVADEIMNNLLVGEFLWDTQGTKIWGSDYLIEYLGTCTAYNYTTEGFPGSWNTTRLFDKDAPAEWSAEDLINAIKDNKITWIDQMGHSNRQFCAKISSSTLNDTVFKAINGVDANYFLMSSVSCQVGEFDSTADCWGEKFVTLPNGPVAFHGNSRSTFSEDTGTNGADQRLLRFFHDAVFDKKIHHLEMMNAYSKEVNAELIMQSPAPYRGELRYCSYGKNIFGDPALSVWTATPQEFQADYPTPLTDTVFKWDTKKPFTWIALLVDDSIICTQLTDSSGTCKIDDEDLAEYVKANPNGSLKVRVKAHNYLPFEGELPINYSTGINSINEDLLFNSNFSFGKRLRITYTVPDRGYVNISIFNSKGVLVKAIVSGIQKEGKHSVDYDIRNFSSGIYYCRLKSLNSGAVNKFLVTK